MVRIDFCEVQQMLPGIATGRRRELAERHVKRRIKLYHGAPCGYDVGRETESLACKASTSDARARVLLPT